MLIFLVLFVGYVWDQVRVYWALRQAEQLQQEQPLQQPEPQVHTRYEPALMSYLFLFVQLMKKESTAQYSTAQYSTVQYSTVQYSTVQYSTVQYSTVQYSTVQYSTVQYSTHNLLHVMQCGAFHMLSVHTAWV